MPDYTMHATMHAFPTFATLADMTHGALVESMMAALYAEDPAAHAVDPAGFRRTIETLVREPAAGRIVLFEECGVPVGYAILIPYWSNEFGGRLIVVDELFVIPERRGRGIGKAFFAHLRATRPMESVGIALEVTPGNARARKLYAALGFSPRKNSLHVCAWRDLRAEAAES